MAIVVLVGWWGASCFFDQKDARQQLMKSLVIEPGSLSILGERIGWLNKNNSPDLETEIEIILAGDVMLGRTVNRRQIANGWDWALREIGSEMATADWTIVNLETPLIENCPPTDEGMIFCAEANSVTGLKATGVDVVNLANNHTLNYGQLGLEETREILQKASIEIVGETGLGDGSLVTKEIAGVKLGLLGFDFVSQTLDEEKVLAQIRVAKNESQVDFLIVTVHWGVEYEFAPREWQRQLAARMAAAGVGAIIGHHSHWIGEREKIEVNGAEVTIYYSLGNLVFDQMWSQKTREGLVVKLKLTGDGKLREVQERRVVIYDFGQPRWDGDWRTAQL